MMNITIGRKNIEIKALNMNGINTILNSCFEQGLTLEKNYRKISNMIIKEDNELYEEINPNMRIKEMIITIEWKKNSTWGKCPYASISNIITEEGEYKFIDYSTKALGYGYDKESTVLSHIFNKFLKYKIHELKNSKNLPYGINKGEYNYFNGGIGTNCYFKITEFLKGEMKTIVNTDKVSVYKIKF